MPSTKLKEVRLNLHYKNSQLHFGLSSFNLQTLIQDYDSPFYVYDLKGIADRFTKWNLAFTKGASVHYAVKANSNLEILKMLKSMGSHVDVVSGGEIKKALEAGFLGRDIIFSGVGKTKSEIELALDSKIYQINVESPAELRRIAEIAISKGLKAPVSLRFNPDVNPETHPYITTGFRENKFGLDESLLPEVIDLLKTYAQSLDLKGLTLHIGSQILDIHVYREAIQKTRTVFEYLKTLGFEMTRFDVGGGVGIHYQEQKLAQEEEFVKAFGQMVEQELQGLNVEIQTEPGRWIVAHSGVLITQVQYIKKTPFKNFAIVDSGMHHLMRPALYGAYHSVWPLASSGQNSLKPYDIVGPICESSDFFAKDRTLPELKENDFLVIADSGAYGFSMASLYNAHGLPKEICLR